MLMILMKASNRKSSKQLGKSEGGRRRRVKCLARRKYDWVKSSAQVAGLGFGLDLGVAENRLVVAVARRRTPEVVPENFHELRLRLWHNGNVVNLRACRAKPTVSGCSRRAFVVEIQVFSVRAGGAEVHHFSQPQDEANL